MKKTVLFMAVLMCVSMSMTAYAQNEPIRGGVPSVENTGRPTPVEDTDPIIENDGLIDGQENSYRLADGEAGRGTIETPDKYWAENGYPDNISFAYEAGSETLEDGTSIAYWEIGIINADEASKQEILALLSPNCRITFRDCKYSYREREAAFNEIYASRNDIVRNVQMALNSEVVFVEIADGYEKEYARKYIEQYGSFVAVTNDITAAMDATEGLGLDGGDKNNAFGLWLWPICLVFLIGAVTIVFFNRTRLIPTLQTNNGNIVTESTPISRKQTISVIKNSVLTPSDDVFGSIMEKVDKAHK